MKYIPAPIDAEEPVAVEFVKIVLPKGVPDVITLDSYEISSSI